MLILSNFKNGMQIYAYVLLYASLLCGIKTLPFMSTSIVSTHQCSQKERLLISSLIYSRIPSATISSHTTLSFLDLCQSLPPQCAFALVFLLDWKPLTASLYSKLPGRIQYSSHLHREISAKCLMANRFSHPY